MSPLFCGTPTLPILILLILNLRSGSGGGGGGIELVVNVKNQGGEIYKETIWANVTENTVHLEIERPDGGITTQFIDFTNDVQIIKTAMLGEEEKHEPRYQILCFVSRFSKLDFIPPDAMAKLRQKNPWAVRLPEKDMGTTNQTMDVLLDISVSDWISPYIKTICSDAHNTYGKRVEVEGIILDDSANANINGSSTSTQHQLENEGHPKVKISSSEGQELLLRAVRPFPLLDQSQACDLVQDSKKACLCRVSVCVGWYPCSLKYCRGRDYGKNSYRCGIHTCRKCEHFSFSVAKRFSCLMS